MSKLVKRFFVRLKTEDDWATGKPRSKDLMYVLIDRIYGAYAHGDKEDMDDWCAELNQKPTARASREAYRAWRAKTPEQQEWAGRSTT